MIVVLSDGMMVDEEEALALLEEGLGSGRFFAVGIGKDVNRGSIGRLAEYGRGTSVFADDPGALERVVAQLFDSVAAPLAWDLAIDWGEASVEGIEPLRLPDLYSGRTVRAIAKVSGALGEEISVMGVTTDGDQTWVGAVTWLQAEEVRGLPAPRNASAPRNGRKQKTPEGR